MAGDLCDKVSMSLVDLNGVSEKITAALNAHNEAVKRLSTGRGNALSIGERIRLLGVKTKRPMPTMLLDDGAIAAATDEFAGNDVSGALTGGRQLPPGSGSRCGWRLADTMSGAVLLNVILVPDQNSDQ